MADVLTPEQLEAAKAAEAAAKETTTNAVTPAASEETPAPTEVIMAKPGEPRTIETFSQKGQPITLTIAKPTKPMALFVTKVLGHDATNQGLFIYYRTLMWLTHVNGVQLQPFTKREDFEGIHELIGDEAIETLVNEVYAEDMIDRISREATKKS